MARKGRRATFEEKVFALRLLERSLSPDRVAETLGVGRESIFRWKRQARTGGTEALQIRKAPGRPRRLRPGWPERCEVNRPRLRRCSAGPRRHPGSPSHRSNHPRISYQMRTAMPTGLSRPTTPDHPRSEADSLEISSLLPRHQAINLVLPQGYRRPRQADDDHAEPVAEDGP
ncbi:helix-turn-helix domain-containing protein [Planomonospora sp. ID67723]|uniref:helix-turn-helix domain-containing protein n=1 Tax=Planomonospora sp. ID67723 TaxID=2738134 RepID=UPI0018C363C3|nr:helix-turn-helix domain-containing protein [Planomonospora sp. ID67723]